MIKKNVLSIDCQIPGGLSHFVDFDSKMSLLDWDIVIFNPGSWTSYISNSNYQGKPTLDSNRSFKFQESSLHWQREIDTAYESGKSIFIILNEMVEFFKDTGQRTYSGTGRNRQETQLVSPTNNYSFLPIDISLLVSEGTEMKLTDQGNILANYWKEFNKYSIYKIILFGKVGNVLIETKSGNKPVSSLFIHEKSGGAIILLPFIDLWSEQFSEEIEKEEEGGENDEESTDFTWTEEGYKFGNKFLHCILEIDKTLKESLSRTPAPDWTEIPDFVLQQELDIKEELIQLGGQIEQLTERMEELKSILYKKSNLKGLLFEKGHALEKAIVEALTILGFSATQYKDSQSEFDVIFESPEGQLLGESEGKDNKPINIEKMRQLEINIHEDFARKEIKDMAKGVLFGNAFRLQRLDLRGDFFTEKCIAASKRNKTALVRTPDLFPLVKYIIENNDMKFAEVCRIAILKTECGIVSFPDIPSK